MGLRLTCRWLFELCEFDLRRVTCNCTVRAPVFGRHQFFGTSEHYGKAHGSLLSGWMNYNYTACCWFPTPSNILILPSQFWKIRFESCWLHCSKCRILVLLWYLTIQIEKNMKLISCRYEHSALRICQQIHEDIFNNNNNRYLYRAYCRSL